MEKIFGKKKFQKKILEKKISEKNSVEKKFLEKNSTEKKFSENFGKKFRGKIFPTQKKLELKNSLATLEL